MHSLSYVSGMEFESFNQRYNILYTIDITDVQHLYILLYRRASGGTG